MCAAAARGEDVGNGSAAESRVRGAEQPLARTEDDRVDDEAVLVDQAGFDQRAGEAHTALSAPVELIGAAEAPNDLFGNPRRQSQPRSGQGRSRFGSFATTAA
jgi:hypothetical protein